MVFQANSCPGLYDHRYRTSATMYNAHGFELIDSIDWVQDAAREQLRRKAQRRANTSFLEGGGRAGFRYKLWQSYEAGQAWIVVTLIGWHRRGHTHIKSTDQSQVLLLDLTPHF